MERRMEADCSGGQSSPRAAAPKGRKEGWKEFYIHYLRYFMMRAGSYGLSSQKSLIFGYIIVLLSVRSGRYLGPVPLETPVGGRVDVASQLHTVCCALTYGKETTDLWGLCLSAEHRWMTGSGYVAMLSPVASSSLLFMTHTHTHTHTHSKLQTAAYFILHDVSLIWTSYVIVSNILSQASVHK
jgi:hypothetical protein